MLTKSGYGYLIKSLIVLGDFIILNTIFILVYYFYYGSIDFVDGNFKLELLLLNISYLLVTSVFGQIHNQRIVYVDQLLIKASQAVFFHALIFISCLSFLGIKDIPNSFFLFYYLGFYFWLNFWWFFSRIILKVYRRLGYNFKRVIIVGAGKTGMKLYDEMQSDLGYGYKIMGFFDDNEQLAESLPKYIGKTNEVEQFALDNRIDEIYCALPGSQDAKIVRLLNFSERNTIRFYIVPEVSRYILRRLHYQMVGNMPTLSIRQEPLQNFICRLFKRLFDLVCSLFFLLLCPMIFIPIAIAVWASSPGPIFFSQMRTGLRGRDFWCYKFRTMRVNEDSDTVQATKDDPRKTRVGEFLRKTNLDELPQFFNVLKGDMSIVGPRPHMLKHTEDYSKLIDTYMVRHLVKPGITGWAQVNGFRGETKELRQMEKRVQYDVWYLEHWSFWLDMKIVILTIYNVFRGDKNAF